MTEGPSAKVKLTFAPIAMAAHHIVHELSARQRTSAPTLLLKLFTLFADMLALT